MKHLYASLRTIAATAFLILAGVELEAQVLDHPTSARVSVVVTGYEDPSVSGTLVDTDMTASITDLTGFQPFNVNNYGDELTAANWETIEPGRIYILSVNSSTNKIGEFDIHISPPTGYSVEIEGLRETEYDTLSGGEYKFRIIPNRSTYSGAAGSASSLTGGKMYWQLSLGHQMDGEPEGCLGIVDSATGDWSALFTPAALANEATSGDVVPYLDGNGSIRQLVTDEVFVDVNTINATSYTIDFYARSTTKLAGTGAPYTFNNASGGTAYPFVRYTVAQDTSNGAPATAIKITCTYNKPDGTVALSRESTLWRTGTGTSNYVWVLTDWHDVGQTGKVVERRVWAALDASALPSGASAGRTETITVEDGGTTVSSTSVNSFATFPWGDELIEMRRGTGTTAIDEKYEYDTDSSDAVNYTYLIRKTDPSGGGWEAYEYYPLQVSPVADPTDVVATGELKRKLRPFDTSPSAAPSGAPSTWSSSSGDVTAYTYDNDSIGFKRTTGITTYVNGTTTGNTTIAYTDPLLVFNADGTTQPAHTINGMNVVVATRDQVTDGATGAQTLQTVTKYYREDVDDELFRNQIHSILSPDHTFKAYAYQRGDYDEATHSFTAKATGSAVRIAEITGTSESTGNVEYDAFDGYTLSDADARYTDTFYLVPGKSTMDITIRNEAALVCRTERQMYEGGSWHTIRWTNYTYDYADHLVSRDTSDGESYTASYSDAGGSATGRLQWEQAENGVKTSYTYDANGRVKAAAKDGGATTTYDYDPDGHIVTKTVSGTGTTETIVSSSAYDQAGRLLTDTPAGLGTTNYDYDPVHRVEKVTAPAADAQTTTRATTIRTYQIDGRLASLTGSGVINKYYTYSVDSSGFLWTRVGVGPGAPASLDASAWDSALGRQASTKVDWLGRTRHMQRQGYKGGADYTEDSNYNAKGQLESFDRAGFAPVRYEYGGLSQVTRSGLAVTNPSGPLDPTSDDRVVDTDQSLTADAAGVLWLTSVTTTYPNADSNAAATVTKKARVIVDATAGCQAEVDTIDADGNTTAVKTVIDRANKTVTESTTRPGLHNASLRVTTNGLLSSVTDAAGHQTSYQYDKLDRLWKTSDPRTLVTTRAYYQNTNLLHTVTDPAGAAAATTYATVTYGYDALGRVSYQADGVGASIYTSYTLLGQVDHQWGNGCEPVQYVYDATYGDRTEQHTFRSGDEWTGTTWPSTPPAGDVVVWHYDAGSGLLASKDFPVADSTSTDPVLKNKTTVSFEYNIRGQVSTRTNGRSIVTTYHYYGDTDYPSPVTGELAALTYSDSTPGVSYTYTRGGRVHTVADVTGTRTFTFDTTYPLREQSEELSGYFGTRTLKPLYETATAAGATSGDTGTVNGRRAGFELDGVSRATTADLHQKFSFDNLGHVLKLETQVYSNPAEDFMYGYDENGFTGLLTSYSCGNLKVSRGYDPYRDLIASVAGEWSKTPVFGHDYTFDPNGAPISDMLSGPAFGDYWDATTTYQHVYNYYARNARGEIATATMYRGNTVPTFPTAPQSGDELPGRRIEYRYDNGGNRESVGPDGGSDATTSPGNEIYGANSRNQITTRTNPTVRVLGTAVGTAIVTVTDATVSQLDRNFGASFVPHNGSGPAQGQATVTADIPGSPDVVKQATRTWFAPPANQTFGYDADGNTTSDGVWTYAFDAEDRLTKMTSALPAGQGFKRLELDFSYDYLNRRVEKVVKDLDANTTTLQRRYVYNGTELVAELDTSGKLLRSFTWGLDVQGTIGATGGVGALLEATWFDGANGTTPENYYPISDASGNVSGLIRATDGAVAAVYEYGAFGEPLRGEINDSIVSADPNPFQFSTGYTDDESGLVYYGRRYYSPALGRFINRDPIEEAGGRNLYGFCANDGVGRYDIQGMGSPTAGSSDTSSSNPNDSAGPAVQMGPFGVSATPIPKSNTIDFGSLYLLGQGNRTFTVSSSDIDTVGLPFTTPNNQLNVTQFINWRPTKRNNAVVGKVSIWEKMLSALTARSYADIAEAQAVGDALGQVADAMHRRLAAAILQGELEKVNGDWSQVDWASVKVQMAVDDTMTAYLAAALAPELAANLKFAFSFDAAESTAPLTIGQILDGAHPDSMIHLTPAPAESFANGVDSGTYWARLGDVSHMTVPEYQVGVVGTDVEASLGQPVSGFVVSSPGTGSFMWEGAFNRAGVMEYTNSGLLKGASYAPIW